MSQKKIMLNANNPAINLSTRTFIASLINQEFGLDESSAIFLRRAIEKAKAISPSGWVFMLARSLGAPMEIATEAASFAEMYYAMCSFTDDVQDGDAADYMLESDERILINTLAQLICITTVRGIKFASHCPNQDTSSEMSKMFLNGGVMLRGQLMELKRENWSTEAYKTVACLSGGRQFDVYFKTAAMAAGISAEPFLRLSDPVGILVQIWHDKQSNDERLLGLPANEVSVMIDSALLGLEEAVNEIPSEAKTLIENMKQYVVNLFQ